MNPIQQGIVLVVDDVPDNLALLYDALDAAGYAVLVATDGESALQRARLSLPDVILLDAVMPGMDGFTVARTLKADFATQAIPIVFMTGLTDTEHVVEGFASGGADYVTKPIRPQEVLARIAAHMYNARQVTQARTALDAFGQATVAIAAASGKLTWQTPLARRLLDNWFGPHGDATPAQLLDWTRLADKARRESREIPALLCKQGNRRLLASFHDQTGDEEWLVVLREEDDEVALATLATGLQLTRREAEVLYWLSLGKTNRDIADILDMSPRTVNTPPEEDMRQVTLDASTAAAALAV